MKPQICLLNGRVKRFKIFRIPLSIRIEKFQVQAKKDFAKIYEILLRDGCKEFPGIDDSENKTFLNQHFYWALNLVITHSFSTLYGLDIPALAHT